MDRDRRVDKYGRLLGKIFHRGMDLGTELMNLGFAVPFEQRQEDAIPKMEKIFAIGQWL